MLFSVFNYQTGVFQEQKQVRRLPHLSADQSPKVQKRITKLYLFRKTNTFTESSFLKRLGKAFLKSVIGTCKKSVHIILCISMFCLLICLIALLKTRNTAFEDVFVTEV